MWKELTSRLWPDAVFFEPAKQFDIANVECELGIILPSDLTDCFQETDGFSAHYSTNFIWRTSPSAKNFDRLEYRNKEMRNPKFKELYQPFDELLLIGDDGGGSLFGYQMIQGKCSSEILYWNHEDDSRSVISKNGLRGYLEFASKMFD